MGVYCQLNFVMCWRNVVLPDRQKSIICLVINQNDTAWSKTLKI